MRIVFNTRYPDSAASYNYRGALESLKGLTFNDRDNYSKYNVALFMTYPKDLDDMAEAKRAYPDIKTGLIDPRGSQVEKYLKFSDFLVIDSIEMQDFFSRYPIPMFKYYEYPNIRDMAKKHKDKQPIIIGYHGNVVHLMSMYPNITRAFELLGIEHQIELWAIYNVEKAGRWRFGLPRGVTVKHIQWSEDNFYEYLSRADIGISPSLMPIRSLEKAKVRSAVSKRLFNDSKDDYLIKFKMPSNPGRFIIFGKFGIPVVADFYPSALQFIRDGHNGALAYSTGGWYRALKTLAESAALRQAMADNMREIVNAHFDFEVQNIKFLEFLERIINGSSQELGGFIEEPLSDLTENTAFRIEVIKTESVELLRNIKRFIFG